MPSLTLGHHFRTSVFLLMASFWPAVGLAQGTLSDRDALRYIASHPDLIQAFGADPAKGRRHYEEWGVKEGRKITFDPLTYTASHPDLVAAFGLDEGRSVTHYIQWGFKEGRRLTFDGLRYIASHPDLITAFGVDADKGTRHYIQWGAKEGRKVTFDPLTYTASHQDLIAAFGLDETKAILHYIQWGAKEGRKVTFDGLRYIASHPDLISAFGPDAARGVRHYIQWGAKEGRKVNFDPLRYMAANPDLIQAFAGDETKAVLHYIQWGNKESRQTALSDFDAMRYIASFPDLMRAFGADALAGIRHYVAWGYNEGRRIVFDALAYIASYGDLITAFGADLTAGVRHYINWGFKEGREATFDALGYLNKHADLRAAFGNDTAAATLHYINWGYREGRTYDYSLTGSFTIPQVLQVDSDTNDPLAVQVGNNSFSQSQTLVAPFTLVGHVNRPGSGPTAGRWYSTGDLNDIFRVTMRKGQPVNLKVIAPTQSAGDVFLELYDYTGTLRAGPLPYSTRHTLAAPNDGDYFIAVRVQTGASRYILETPPFNQTSELSASSQSQDTENFVPGELIVTFHQEQDAGLIDRGTALTTKTSQGDSTAVAYRLRETLGGASYTVDLQLDSFSKTLAVEDRASLLPGKFVDEEQRLRYLTVMASRDFAQDRAVKSTSLNYIRSAAAVPNDPMYANQRWHYEQVNLPAAWDISTGSPDVVVAVVDSGVSAHPDLVPNLLAGYDFVSSDPQGDGDGEDSDPSDPGKWVSAGPRSSHGTHVAGTVAARGNNSIGVTGASWSTSILPVRALGAGGTGTDSDIIRGIRYAAGLLPDRKPPKIANIINLSLGASNNFCPSSYLELFKELRALGIIIVAANGNGKANGTNFVSSPANCAGVVSVAATDSNRNITFYSQEGSETDLAAPGGSASFLSSDGVYSTNISRIDQAETQYIFNALSGTSMAAPHVAGIISLMKAVRPSLTPVEFESLVASGYLSNDIGTPGRDNASGYGLIDARKAVSVVSGTLPNIPPRIEVLSTRLDFGAATVTLPVIVTVIGNATSPTTVTADLTGTPPWVKVATPQQLNDRTYSFNVSVDRGLAFNGVFQTSIAFKATAGSATVSTVNVPLSMSKPSSTAIGDGGSQYAVLVEAKTGRTTLTNLFRPRGASFAFTMVGAPRGTYYLFAGTDVDNNLRICEPGELCSVYEVNVGTPREFLIDRPIRGIGITMRLIDVTATSSFAAGPYNLAGQLLDMGVSRNLGESSSGYYRLLGIPSP